MAPPPLSVNALNKMVPNGGELPLPISLEGSYLLASGHPFLANVPSNIVVTPAASCFSFEGESTDHNYERGCFLGFDEDEPRSSHVVPIGELSGIKFMSIFRFKTWWSTYWSGHSGKDVEIETQIMILDRNDSGRPYILLLPIIEGSFRSSLQAGVNNFVDLFVESGSNSVRESMFRSCLYMHYSRDPFRLIKEGMRAVRTHLGTFKLLEEKNPPGIIDRFGWCTWDAFYRDVNPTGVRDGVKVLSEGGCPPGWVLIDDGWQSICHDTEELDDETEGMDRMADWANETPRLKSFEVNYRFKSYESPRMPSNKGMGAFIRDLKEEFRTVEYAYVWHAFLGYWGGIRPHAPGMPKSKFLAPVLPQNMQTSMDDGALNNILRHGIGFVPPERAYQMYEGIHSYLASVGVDGVKIDSIQVLEMLCEEYGGRVDLAKDYYKALTASIRKHLKGNGVIASMQQANDFMFLGTEAIALGRVGDDFWVVDPAGDESGKRWLQGCHMVHCAYNSLWMCNFIHPDWDMFQSTHPLAEFHAASRAICGGPIYVSDCVGEHNFELLKRLVLLDGSILRCQSYAYPTRDCLFVDPLHDGTTMLKIWNLNRHAGVLGVFNCQGGGWCRTIRRNRGYPHFAKRVQSSVSPMDVEWENGKKPVSNAGFDAVAVYMEREKKVKIMELTESLEISLDPLNYELLTVCPVHILSRKSIQVAPIGLVNMLNPGGAIQSLVVNKEQNSVTIGIKGSGEMKIFASEKPTTCKIDKVDSEFCYKDNMITVQVTWPCSPRFSMIEILF